MGCTFRSRCSSVIRLSGIALLVLLPLCLVSQDAWNIEHLENREQLTFAPNTTTPYTGKGQKYHSNGKIAETGFYKNGLKSGSWLEFNSTGLRVVERTFENGILRGSLKEWYSNGILKSSTQCIDGEIDGVMWLYREDGTKSAMFTFVAGNYNGNCSFWSSDGTLETTGSYVYRQETRQSYKFGEWIQYFKDGSIFEKGSYGTKANSSGHIESCKIGHWSTYIPGTTALFTQERFGISGSKVDTMIFYDNSENNTPTSGWVYKNKQCVKLIDYYPSGQIASESECHYVGGSAEAYQASGNCIEFFSNGQVKGRGLLDTGGFRIGVWTEYKLEDGRSQRRYYISPWSQPGMIDTITAVYTEKNHEGIIVAEGPLLLSSTANWNPVNQSGYVRDGVWKIWNDSLKKIIQITYDNGYPIIDF